MTLWKKLGLGICAGLLVYNLMQPVNAATITLGSDSGEPLFDNFNKNNGIITSISKDIGDVNLSLGARYDLEDEKIAKVTPMVSYTHEIDEDKSITIGELATLSGDSNTSCFDTFISGDMKLGNTINLGFDIFHNRGYNAQNNGTFLNVRGSLNLPSDFSLFGTIGGGDYFREHFQFTRAQLGLSKKFQLMENLDLNLNGGLMRGLTDDSYPNKEYVKTQLEYKF